MKLPIPTEYWLVEAAAANTALTGKRLGVVLDEVVGTTVSSAEAGFATGFAARFTEAADNGLSTGASATLQAAHGKSPEHTILVVAQRSAGGAIPPGTGGASVAFAGTFDGTTGQDLIELRARTAANMGLYHNTFAAEPDDENAAELLGATETPACYSAAFGGQVSTGGNEHRIWQMVNNAGGISNINIQISERFTTVDFHECDEVSVGVWTASLKPMEMDVSQVMVWNHRLTDTEHEYLSGGGAGLDAETLAASFFEPEPANPPLLVYEGTDVTTYRDLSRATTTGELTVGVVFERSVSDGEDVTIVIRNQAAEVVASQTITVDASNLDNNTGFSAYSEDGYSFTVEPGVLYEVALSVPGGSAFVGEGIIVREAQHRGGCVNKVGRSLYCQSPAAKLRTGQLVELRRRMYDGEPWIYVNEQPVGALDTSLIPSGDREHNDIWHDWGAVLEVTGGVLVILGWHNKRAWAYFAPTPEGLVTATPRELWDGVTNTSDSYCQMAEDPNQPNRVKFACRIAANGGAHVVTISDVTDLANATMTFDRLTNAKRMYPIHMGAHTDADGDTVWSYGYLLRDSNQNYAEAGVAFLQDGTNQWYNTQGDTIGSTTTGTAASPRWTLDQIEDKYDDATPGLAFFTANASGQRAVHRIGAWLDDWSTGGRSGGACFVFTDNASGTGTGAFNQYNGATDVQFGILIGDQRTLTTAAADPFGQGPVGGTSELGLQNWRISYGFQWRDQPGGILDICMTIRGNRRVNDKRYDMGTARSLNPYYDRGGQFVRLFSVDLSSYTPASMPTAGALVTAIEAGDWIAVPGLGRSGIDERGNPGGIYSTVADIWDVPGAPGGWLLDVGQEWLADQMRETVPTLHNVTYSAPSSGGLRSRDRSRAR